jgi:hypothetical protein
VRLAGVFSVTAVAVFLLIGGVAAAEFSADIVQTVGAKKLTYRLYVKRQKIRQEVQQPYGPPVTAIMRPDRGLLWIVTPQKKSYREVRGGKNALSADIMEQRLKKTATRKPVGKQTIGGYVCDKYVYTFKNKKRGTVTEWFAPKLGFQLPIKMVMIRPASPTITIEYKNIKQTSLPDSLFEPPTGYRKTSGKPGF